MSIGAALTPAAGPPWLAPLVNNLDQVPHAYRRRVPPELLAAVPGARDASATGGSSRDAAVLVLFGALAYFIMPFDAIPDFLLGLGFTDDAAVMLAAYTAARLHITEDHRARARAWLNRSPAGSPVSSAAASPAMD